MSTSSRHRRHRLLGAALIAVAMAIALPALAGAKDRNHDNLPDRWERKHDLSLQHNQTHRDQDRDGLDNRGEFRGGMDPRDADSDDDGIEDGDEDAGRISSFDSSTGELVINTFSGGPVTGMVTDETEISATTRAPGMTRATTDSGTTTATITETEVPGTAATRTAAPGTVTTTELHGRRPGRRRDRARGRARADGLRADLRGGRAPVGGKTGIGRAAISRRTASRSAFSLV